MHMLDEPSFILGTHGDTLGISGDQLGTNGDEWGEGEGGANP